jgi:hypothetical protein
VLIECVCGFVSESLCVSMSVYVFMYFNVCLCVLISVYFNVHLCVCVSLYECVCVCMYMSVCVLFNAGLSL